MKELNKDKLIEGLQKLPEYKAPDFIWDQLNQDLKQDPTLNKAIKELPSYEAPDHIWNSIDQEINKTPKLISLRSVSRIAAAVAILVVAIFGINLSINQQSSDPFENLAVTISEEKVDNIALDINKEDNQSVIDELLVMCNNMEFICTRPRITKLKNDLLELSEAKKLIREALGEYGTEVYLIKQLKNIEIEQSILIKELTKQLT